MIGVGPVLVVSVGFGAAAERRKVCAFVARSVDRCGGCVLEMGCVKNWGMVAVDLGESWWWGSHCGSLAMGDGVPVVGWY
jgi:hypothetical protein